LSYLQWKRIKDSLPGRREHAGRTAADNRSFVNGVPWVLLSGARWANSSAWKRGFHEVGSIDCQSSLVAGRTPRRRKLSQRLRPSRHQRILRVTWLKAHGLSKDDGRRWN
jgi:transposase